MRDETLIEAAARAVAGSYALPEVDEIAAVELVVYFDGETPDQLAPFARALRVRPNAGLFDAPSGDHRP